jgi:hypothetical protein
VLLIIIIGGILVLFIYITKLASNEIFSPSNKIHREVGRAKDLLAPRYYRLLTTTVQHTFMKVKQSVCRSGQALRVPGGSGSQISRQAKLYGGKVVSPKHRPLLTSRRYSWYSFLLETGSTPGP